MQIDLNCDMGEGAGSPELDAKIMQHISSVNIACGMHAGGPDEMYRCVELAVANNVAIGAHPGFDDKAGFGRKFMELTDKELEATLLYQIGALKTMAEAAGAQLNHVKPHGAMYNHAAVNYDYALTIAQTIKKIDPALILIGLANSDMQRAASAIGLPFANEVFADRRYCDDGQLMPRTMQGAVIDKIADCFNQVEHMVLKKQIISASNNVVDVDAQTICVHGDTPNGAVFIEKIYEFLRLKNIDICSIHNS